MKKLAKKKSAKKPAKKTAAQKREDKIAEILSMVSKICNYAINNLCTEQAQFEELEWKLNQYILKQSTEHKQKRKLIESTQRKLGAFFV